MKSNKVLHKTTKCSMENYEVYNYTHCLSPWNSGYHISSMHASSLVQFQVDTFYVKTFLKLHRSNTLTKAIKNNIVT